jgi:hypothetical protein
VDSVFHTGQGIGKAGGYRNWLPIVIVILSEPMLRSKPGLVPASRVL